jgi:dolichyl-phosphate beta-glucosyltransferase
MDISIIVPAYNEEKRITPFLKDLMEFSKNLKDYEIIFVSDGSTDNTVEVIKKHVTPNKNVRIIGYPKNTGKGYAVKQGIKTATGNKILFIDADGSIHPDQIPYMLEKLNYYDVVVGDRASKNSIIDRPTKRHIVGTIFNTISRLLFQIRVKDTLCGFKGFKKEVAKSLFKDLKSYGWIFDVELFYKIKKNKYSLYKLPLRWTHKEESKFKLFDPLKMLFDLFKLRLKLIK